MSADFAAAGAAARPPPLSERLKWLQALQDMLNQNWDEAVQCIVSDLNRPVPEADTEIAVLAREIADLKADLSSWAKPQPLSTHLMFLPAFSQVRRSPYGAVLIIGPFNYPLMLTLAPLAGALAAGNVACVKLSDQSPATSSFIARYAPMYLPSNVAMFVEGGVPETTRLLDLRWDFIVFTGSTRVAGIVQQAAAKFMTPCLLECGGKCPAIVDETVDNIRETAKRIASTKLVNAGQSCVTPDYVLVHKSKHADLVAALCEEMHRILGPEAADSANLGRLCQPHMVERAAALLDESGGSLYQIGTASFDSASRFVPPIIVDSPSENSKLLSEELFNPILPVVPFTCLEEAIERSRRIDPTPLAFYFFGSTPRAESVALQTKSGAFVVNDCFVHNLNHSLPFGGVATSGQGVYNGKWSFETFTYPRAFLWRYGSLCIDQLLPFPVRYPVKDMTARSHWRRKHLLRVLFLYAPYIRIPLPSFATIILCFFTFWVARATA